MDDLLNTDQNDILNDADHYKYELRRYLISLVQLHKSEHNKPNPEFNTIIDCMCRNIDLLSQVAKDKKIDAINISIDNNYWDVVRYVMDN